MKHTPTPSITFALRTGRKLACMPAAVRDPDGPRRLIFDGRHKQFSEEVTDVIQGSG